MPSPAITKTLDFRDTFLDAQHVVDAFPTAQVTFPSGPSGKPSAEMKPPFRLTITTPVFPAAADGGGGGSEAEEKAEKDSREETVTCVAYTAPNPGPYPQVLLYSTGHGCLVFLFEASYCTRERMHTHAFLPCALCSFNSRVFFSVLYSRQVSMQYFHMCIFNQSTYMCYIRTNPSSTACGLRLLNRRRSAAG
jgi:hypothetical protein